jgi:hypothetical protein
MEDAHHADFGMSAACPVRSNLGNAVVLNLSMERDPGPSAGGFRCCQSRGALWRREDGSAPTPNLRNRAEIVFACLWARTDPARGKLRCCRFLTLIQCRDRSVRSHGVAKLENGSGVATCNCFVTPKNFKLA